MGWIWAFAGLVTVTCFVVIGMTAWKTFQKVRSLGKKVAASSRQIAEASATLDQIRPLPRD